MLSLSWQSFWNLEFGIWNLELEGKDSKITDYDAEARKQNLCIPTLDIGHWTLDYSPDVVGDQIFIRIAAANQVGVAVAANHHRGRQWPPVVMKHLRQ
jgi:hypothetical protein